MRRSSEVRMGVCGVWGVCFSRCTGARTRTHILLPAANSRVGGNETPQTNQTPTSREPSTKGQQTSGPECDPPQRRRNHAMRTTSKKPARTKPEAKKGEAAPPPSRSRATPSARRSAGPRFACRSGLAASRSGRRRSRASSPRSARPIRITSDGLPPVAAACTGELLRAHPEVRRTATTATVTT